MLATAQRTAFLNRLFGSAKDGSSRRSSDPSRPRTLRLEMLERREMLSVLPPDFDFPIPVSREHIQVVVGFLPGTTPEAKTAAREAVDAALGGAPIEVSRPTLAHGDAEMWTLPLFAYTVDVQSVLYDNKSIAYLDEVGRRVGDPSVSIQDWKPMAGAEEPSRADWEQTSFYDKISIMFPIVTGEIRRTAILALISGEVESRKSFTSLSDSLEEIDYYEEYVVRLPEGVSAWKAIQRLHQDLRSDNALIFVTPIPLKALNKEPVFDLSMNHMPGELLINLRPGADQAKVDKFLSQLPAQVLAQFSFSGGKELYVKLVDYTKVDESQLIPVNEKGELLPQPVKYAGVSDAILTKVRSQLLALDEVESVALNTLGTWDLVPNDTHLVNGNGWGDYGDVNGATALPLNQFGSQAAEAWLVNQLGTQAGSPNVVVAVIDTGVMLTHPDLAGNIWTNPNEISGNGIDDDGNGYVDDVNGWDFRNGNNSVFDQYWENNQWVNYDQHGTQISGVIGAVTNNSAGIAGVAPNVRILPLKVGETRDSGPSWNNVTAALQYLQSTVASSNQPGRTPLNLVVLNMSFEFSAYDANAEAALTALTTSGVVSVASAGNSSLDIGPNPRYPARFTPGLGDRQIVVNSINSGGTRSSSSNFSTMYVDVAAPGEYIVSTSSSNSTTSNATVAAYVAVDGTSFAAPYVAGSVALLAGANQLPGTPGPHLQGWQADVWRSRIMDAATQTATNNVLNSTGGRLNLGAVFSPATIGVYDPSSSLFLLNYTSFDGLADRTFGFAWSSSFKPIAGDWNNDTNGIDSIGLYNSGSSTFYLRNTNNSGNADFTFGFGTSNWVPIAGDWNGDGVDTIGLYDPSTSIFYLRNSNSTGFADLTFGFGAANWVPIAGDWNNDGTDTIGLYDPVTSIFYLRNSNDSGYANISFAYGVANSGSRPVAGDWNGDRVDTIGLYQPTGSVFSLRNTNSTGYADITQPFAWSNLLPVVGDFEGHGALPPALHAAGLPSEPRVTDGITAADVAPFLAAAIARWELAVPGAGDALAGVDVVVTDLPGTQLGMAEGGRIYLDRDAAGWGWFIDRTPNDDDEFSAETGRALDPRAVDRVDLLSVVEHELGHVRGLADLDSSLEDLMSATLSSGVRRRQHQAT